MNPVSKIFKKWTFDFFFFGIYQDCPFPTTESVELIRLTGLTGLIE